MEFVFFVKIIIKIQKQERRTHNQLAHLFGNDGGSVGKTTKEEDMRFSPFFKASPMYKILCCLPSVETGSVNQFETTKKLW